MWQPHLLPVYLYGSVPVRALSFFWILRYIVIYLPVNLYNVFQLVTSEAITSRWSSGKILQAYRISWPIFRLERPIGMLTWKFYTWIESFVGIMVLMAVGIETRGIIYVVL